MSTFLSHPVGSGPVWAWPSQRESEDELADFLVPGESRSFGPVENTSKVITIAYKKDC